jgi:hypothetical protein
MPSLPPEPDLFLLFTQRLEQAEIEYMVSGSVAAMAYGQPRLTTDVDVIVSMDFSGAVRLFKLFPAEEFYLPPVEIIASELTRPSRGHFNILHMDSGFKADIYLRGNDPFRAWALERVREIKIGSATIRMAPPEYVIVRKLEFFREGGSEKHLRDIKMMLDTSKDRFDLNALSGFILERGLTPEWERAQTVQL